MADPQGRFATGKRPMICGTIELTPPRARAARVKLSDRNSQTFDQAAQTHSCADGAQVGYARTSADRAADDLKQACRRCRLQAAPDAAARAGR